MTTLFIDTSSNVEVTVGLTIDGEKYRETRKLDRKKAQIVIPMIEEIIKEHDLELADLDTIEVNIGPGSFTGLRVGVSIANTLGAFLNIPINSKRPGELVQPIYN